MPAAKAGHRAVRRSASVAAIYCRAFDCDLPPDILETRSLDDRSASPSLRTGSSRPVRSALPESLDEDDEELPTPIPRIVVNKEDAPAIRGQPRPNRLSSLRSIMTLPRRLAGMVPGTRKQGDKALCDNRVEEYDFIKDKVVNKKTSRHTTDDSVLFTMSGALPDDAVDTASQDSFIFSSPALSDSDTLPDPRRRRRSSSQLSFDSSFHAGDRLRTAGLQAPSETFSQQSMHLLSECVSPEKSQAEHASHPFRRDVVAVEDGANDLVADANSAAAARLPTELIQSIYWYLGAYEFNAARHTCHKWMVASLELKLLSEQIKRGGWWASAQKRPELFSDWKRAWPMSCFLARQCALSGNWTGQHFRVFEGAQDIRQNAFHEIREVDFSGLGKDLDQSCDTAQEQKPMVCATSLCGRFSLIARGCEIYTYEIDGRNLSLLSQVSCERKVLAMSIDVSNQRFVIAALLDGRIGLFLDLLQTKQPTPPVSPWESPDMLNSATSDSGQILDFGDSPGPATPGPVRDIPVGDFDELSVNAASVGSNSILHRSVETVTERDWAQYLHGTRARLRGMRQMPASSNGLWPDTMRLRDEDTGKNTDAKLRPQIVYRSICTDEDPPTSIAISPTRQCVAFGCKSGVELYWIDVTTGQNLNRWFPLTKASDHLYFLPPRKSIDNPLRLRLISTATCPEGSGYLEEQSTTPNSQTTFWFTLSASWRFPIPRASRRQTPTIDHSYALPLSDGHHILFTDNETGLLHSGSDRPVGSTQRLSRKFAFQPPLNLLTSNTTHVPTLYAASNASGESLRIVAGFGDEIMLYSIPVDALEYSTAEQEQTLQDSSKPFEQLNWVDALKHPTSNTRALQDLDSKNECHESTRRINMQWAHYLPRAGGDVPSSLETLWPLKISGTSVGSLDGLKTLLIQDTVLDGLIIWAFSKTGVAKAWRLNDGQRQSTCTRSIVGSDGMVRQDEVPIDIAAETT